ncbi:hypothetical protein BKA70DRAFT_1215037 [Coprinopsis sp. MPI-PUGE-AT-0042]|nr:hypothetical protein BKA70DRAFT_1215037 [Coprinopsis sp. MPI-PUGE-AT-0042]
MLKKITTLAAFSSCAALATAQSTITLYDLSLAAPSSAGTGFPGQLSDVLYDVVQGAGDIKASAVAVDPEGATYYVGVRPVSVVPTTASGRVTTAILPTPSTETLTFRADASQVFNEVHTTTTIDGIRAEIDVAIVCTHDVDDDTPVEEAEIVCRQRAVYNLEDGGVTVGTTVLATTTGEVREILTVTNPANLTLPTTDGDPIDVPETTSQRLPPQTTRRPTPVDDSDDQEPESSAAGEPDAAGDAGLGPKMPGILQLGSLAAIVVLAKLL